MSFEELVHQYEVLEVLLDVPSGQTVSPTLMSSIPETAIKSPANASSISTRFQSCETKDFRYTELFRGSVKLH